MPIALPPPDAPVAQCVIGASRYYSTPEMFIRAVMAAEGGGVGVTSRNRNRTDDLGIMQINSVHLTSPPHQLAQYGLTREALVNNACLNIYVGTYILSYEINHHPGDLWTALGAYHSHTPAVNTAYQWRVWHKLQRLAETAP